MNPHDDPELLRELAQRATGAVLYPGTLPPSLPFDLPLPPSARLVGSTVTTPPPLSLSLRQAMERGTSVLFTQPSDSIAIFLHFEAPPHDVRAFFDHVFAQQGWSQVIPGYGMIFFTSFDRPLGIVYRNKRRQHVHGWFEETSDGHTEAALRFDAVPFEEPRHPDFDRIPFMRNTETITFGRRSGNSRPGHATWEGEAKTDGTLGDVGRAIGDQLSDKGWSMRESGSGNAIAYTVWDVPHDPPARGWAIVSTESRPRRMHYQITITWDVPEHGRNSGERFF